MLHQDGLYLAAAVALLLLAHSARAGRWAFLFPKSYLTGRLGLLIGLAIGYAVNALIPLRVGELVRGGFVTHRKKIRFSYVMATIVAERVADLAVLAAVIAGTSGLAVSPGRSVAVAGLFAGSAAALFVLALLLRRSGRVRRAVWSGAGIFNDRIRVGLADFVWSASELLLGGALLRWRFLVATVLMWSLYAAAYVAFGQAVHAPVLDVVAAVLQQPLESLAMTVRGGTPISPTSALIFVLAPILLILGYGALMQSGSFARAANVLLRHGRSGRGSAAAQSERFRALSGYESFLGALFSGEDQAVSGFGMEAVSDCIVHKFFHGGSDAVTALVENNQRMMIRKFAVGSAAEKLRGQAQWLQRHAGCGVPLVEIIGERTGSNVYSYDMPLVTPANDFYDVIHSSPAARNVERLGRVLDYVDAFHKRNALGDADPLLVERYVEEKVSRNAKAIVAFAHHSLGREEYRINGVDHHLDEWRSLSDARWVLAQLQDRRIAHIHGDLTIENVIIAPDYPAGLYIIDPNPENIFDSPLIDWAKMMQSLHLGYETLNRAISVSLSGGELQLATARSQAYAELHATLEKEILARFGEGGLREVYFHEIVNYLRLTTYKIRQSHNRGLGFFTCTSLLLRNYREKFG